MSDRELARCGGDPVQRIRFTGHATHLRLQWSQSIGCWGSFEADEMISRTEPHKALLHLTPSAFNRFRTRHRLMTRRQFVKVHGPDAWTKGELCFEAHARAQCVLSGSHGHLPIGSACAYALATSRTPIGLLPVEVVLWARLFDEVLAHHGLDIDDWRSLAESQKSLVWDAGRDGTAWGIDPSAPAVLYLHEDDRSTAA